MSRHSEPLEDATQPDVLIIGLGNLLLGDEGVGVHLLRYLECNCRFEPDVRLVDGGTSGLDLLPLFAEHPRILMIDAVVVADAAPGTLVTLHNAEIQRLLARKLSVHHLGVSDLLALADLLDYPVRDLALVGLVPERLELDLTLSPRLHGVLPAAIAAIRALLLEWGVVLQEIGSATGDLAAGSMSLPPPIASQAREQLCV